MSFKSAIWLLPLLLGSSCVPGSTYVPLVDMDAAIRMDLGVSTRNTMAVAAAPLQGTEVRYFVFDRSSGRLESTASSTYPQGTTISILPGEKEVWAVSCFDFSRLEGCQDLQSFKSEKILLEDNSLDGQCPMSGNASVYAYSESMADAEIELSHYAVRINVKQVSNDLAAPLSGESVKICGAFVTNVIGACRIDGEHPDDFDWYNVGGCTSKCELVSRTLEISCPYGESVSPDATFLFYPNDGSTLVTRLVLDVMIRDKRFYYPVDLSSAKRNHTYNLLLGITRPGSSDPDSKDFGLAGALSVEIEDFEGGEDEIEIFF